MVSNVSISGSDQYQAAKKEMRKEGGNVEGDTNQSANEYQELSRIKVREVIKVNLNVRNSVPYLL